MPELRGNTESRGCPRNCKRLDPWVCWHQAHQPLRMAREGEGYRQTHHASPGREPGDLPRHTFTTGRGAPVVLVGASRHVSVRLPAHLFPTLAGPR